MNYLTEIDAMYRESFLSKLFAVILLRILKEDLSF